LCPDAATVLKGSSLVEFLDLPPKHSEDDLQRGLIEQLKQFLIELGRDFCYVGSQYPIRWAGVTSPSTCSFSIERSIAWSPLEQKGIARSRTGPVGRRTY
jgi:hypothetical protein